jgi:hypothetical protein
MMIVAVLAPEFMVGFAARQFFVAQRFSKSETPLQIVDGYDTHLK